MNTPDENNDEKINAALKILGGKPIEDIQLNRFMGRLFSVIGQQYELSLAEVDPNQKIRELTPEEEQLKDYWVNQGGEKRLSTFELNKIFESYLEYQKMEE